jgi:hypothetical protein
MKQVLIEAYFSKETAKRILKRKGILCVEKEDKNIPKQTTMLPPVV